jgi:hypothetical protein
MADVEPPEFYADGVEIGLGPFGATLVFNLSIAGARAATQPTRVANVRMSLEQAKVLAILLKKQVKVFEDQLGTPVPIHPQVYQQLGLSPQEDW